MRKLYRAAGIALAVAFSAGAIAPATAATPNEPAWEELEPPKEIATPRGIGVVNDQDIWAFGQGEDDKALSAHWDGKAWQTVPMPEFTELGTFAARSGDDVWVGGRNLDPSGEKELAKFLAHWDGKSWSVVDPFESSDDKDYESMVNDITFLDGDVWVGGGCCGKPGWLTRWDGKQWHEVQLPNSDRKENLRYPEGLVATKSGELVTAGTQTGDGAHSPLLLRGNKDGFEQQQAPEDSNGDVLWRLGTTDGETLHAAGYAASEGSNAQPVFYSWDGSKWSKDEAPEVPAENDCLVSSMARAGNSLYATSDAIQSYTPCTFRLSEETAKWEQIPSHGLTGNSVHPGLVIGGSDNSDTLWAYGSAGKDGIHFKRYRP